MIHSFFSVIIAFFSLIIIRDKDTFFNCPAKIKVFSVTFLALTLNPVRAVNRFSAILSAFAKSFVWRSIYYSNS
jgi:hypothetical protein